MSRHSGVAASGRKAPKADLQCITSSDCGPSSRYSGAFGGGHRRAHANEWSDLSGSDSDDDDHWLLRAAAELERRLLPSSGAAGDDLAVGERASAAAPPRPGGAAAAPAPHVREPAPTGQSRGGTGEAPELGRLAANTPTTEPWEVQVRVAPPLADVARPATGTQSAVAKTNHPVGLDFMAEPGVRPTSVISALEDAVAKAVQAANAAVARALSTSPRPSLSPRRQEQFSHISRPQLSSSSHTPRPHLSSSSHTPRPHVSSSPVHGFAGSASVPTDAQTWSSSAALGSISATPLPAAPPSSEHTVTPRSPATTPALASSSTLPPPTPRQPHPVVPRLTLPGGLRPTWLLPVDSAALDEGGGRAAVVRASSRAFLWPTIAVDAEDATSSKESLTDIPGELKRERKNSSPPECASVPFPSMAMAAPLEKADLKKSIERAVVSALAGLAFGESRTTGNAAPINAKRGGPSSVTTRNSTVVASGACANASKGGADIPGSPRSSCAEALESAPIGSRGRPHDAVGIPRGVRHEIVGAAPVSARGSRCRTPDVPRDSPRSARHEIMGGAPLSARGSRCRAPDVPQGSPRCGQPDVFSGVFMSSRSRGQDVTSSPQGARADASGSMPMSARSRTSDVIAGTRGSSCQAVAHTQGARRSPPRQASPREPPRISPSRRSPERVTPHASFGATTGRPAGGCLNSPAAHSSAFGRGSS